MRDSIKTGTTTVGIKCSDGVILAADMRATMGHFIANKEVEKILPIQPHIAITTAGLVGDNQSLARIMSVNCSLYEKQKRKRISVEAASTLLANILQESKYFPYWVEILMGGYDDNGPALYEIDAAGGKMSAGFMSTGSGSPVAYGVLEEKLRDKKTYTVKEALPVAAKAVWAAMQRDSASGEGINIAVIDEKGFRKLTKHEIEKLL